MDDVMKENPDLARTSPRRWRPSAQKSVADNNPRWAAWPV
jgi:hypothetical protein